MATGWRQNVEFWEQIPALSTARFLGAVFCLFASFSFIGGTISFGQANLTSNICFALVNGFAATLWAVTGTRRTEVADDYDRDLGLEPLKSVLIENAGAPLPELADRLRRRALDHGKQTDDQTLLLIRHSRAI